MRRVKERNERERNPLERKWSVRYARYAIYNVSQAYRFDVCMDENGEIYAGKSCEGSRTMEYLRPFLSRKRKKFDAYATRGILSILVIQVLLRGIGETDLVCWNAIYGFSRREVSGIVGREGIQSVWIFVYLFKRQNLHDMETEFHDFWGLSRSSV